MQIYYIIKTMKILPITFILLIMFSCKKENTLKISKENTTSLKKYKKLKYEIHSGDTIFYQYENDVIQRISGPSKSKPLIEFKYTDSGFEVIQITDTSTYLIYKCVYNSDKNTDLITLFSKNNEKFQFSYQSNYLLSIDNLTKGKVTYQWSNGNITSANYSKSNYSTQYFEYWNYENKNFWKICNFENLFWIYSAEIMSNSFPVGIENKNLLKYKKNSKNQIIDYYEYEFDNDGYVLKRIEKNYSYDSNGNQILNTNNQYELFEYVWY